MNDGAGGIIRVAGVGCRRDCPAASIRELLDRALAECGLTTDDLTGLASVDHKEGEVGLRIASHTLGLGLSLWSPEDLRRFENRIYTHSRHSRSTSGTGSVAEAAALAAASCGDPADAHTVLSLPRRSSGAATVAIATRDGTNAVPRNAGKITPP